MKRITAAHMMGLSPKKACFVVEYIKDFAPRRAAEASGYAPDSGYKLVNEPEIARVIDSVLQQRLELSLVNAEWVLGEMVDNHMIARQQGNITASNTALAMLSKHKSVDAFAAEKLKVSTDADVAERLNAARERLSASESPPKKEEVSFF